MIVAWAQKYSGLSDIPNSAVLTSLRFRTSARSKVIPPPPVNVLVWAWNVWSEPAASNHPRRACASGMSGFMCMELELIIDRERPDGRLQDMRATTKTAARTLEVTNLNTLECYDRLIRRLELLRLFAP